MLPWLNSGVSKKEVAVPGTMKTLKVVRKILSMGEWGESRIWQSGAVKGGFRDKRSCTSLGQFRKARTSPTGHVTKNVGQDDSPKEKVDGEQLKSMGNRSELREEGRERRNCGHRKNLRGQEVNTKRG